MSLFKGFRTQAGGSGSQVGDCWSLCCGSGKQVGGATWAKLIAKGVEINMFVQMAIKNKYVNNQGSRKPPVTWKNPPGSRRDPGGDPGDFFAFE